MTRISVLYLNLLQFLLISLMVPASYSEAAPTPCLDLIRPMEEKRDSVTSTGGLWAVFEKSPRLTAHSSKAIQLESRINEVFFILKHLCSTREGIPLNELADYVSRDLKAKGPGKFRKELIILGKSEGEIDIWFKFADFAVKNQNRKLKLSHIKETISQAEPFFNRYVELITASEGIIPADQMLSRTLSLIDDLDHFKEKDRYFAQGIEESLEVPFWDIDESSGGS